jgi:putative N6-adenine-specific DNA methylase
MREAQGQRLACGCARAQAQRMSGPWVEGELPCYAVTAPGLEAVCTAELRALGVEAEAEDAGAAWRGDARALVRANVELRSASRVVVRLGSFRARSFHELERRAPKLPWSWYVAGGAAVALRVTARKSKLYHEGAVAERLARLLEAEHGVAVEAARGDADGEAAGGGQLFVVRIFRDVVTVSADASGALLHQRGYRQAVAKAPLRETIAAAMLLATGWDGREPLADPMCGSGTLPIEAALLARRIAPGLASPERRPRQYAFEAWPGYDRTLLDDVVAESRGRIRDVAVPILCADRDAGAVRAAHANAERAGVAADLEFATRPLRATLLPQAPGLVATNPPYGVRVGDRRTLAPLYGALGDLVRGAPGWRLAMLSADPALDAATGLPLQERLRTRNGGIAVRLLTA